MSCEHCGGGWREIETAPKDGTWIVAIGYPKHAKGDGYPLRAALTRWWSASEAPSYVVGWSYSAPGYADVFEPTLWLPAPPPSSDRGTR